ncbi:hypothetical protein [Cytobacillus firmus]|uniref:hypothetical protein n=1 Tax=Cytobacillus firmus TaxID=1399 RepID=UPI0018CFAA77|nr:hypothetical protein [Cytobacillus firmus]
MDGTRSIEVLADKIESTDGKKVGQFSTVFTFADTTRAGVKEVKYVDARTAEIHLDEPVTSFGTATASYEDSTLGAIVVGAPASDSATQVNVTLTSLDNLILLCQKLYSSSF